MYYCKSCIATVQVGITILRDFLVVKNPEIGKLFADLNRRRILHNLRHQEMTACQLARVLEKNVSSISYHLSALEKAGLVEQSRISVKGNLVRKHYRATANKFIISYTLSDGLVPGSEEIVEWTKELCKQAVSNLGAFGIWILPEETEKWVNLMEKHTSLRKMAYEKVISRQVSRTSGESQALQMVLDFLANAYLYGDAEYLGLMKEILQKTKEKNKGQKGMN